MKKHKLVAEHDDHFIVDDGKGPLKIAKLHLHHGTVEKIRQHFAEGGLVEDDPAVSMIDTPQTGGSGSEIPTQAELLASRYAAEDARNKAANLSQMHPDPRSLTDQLLDKIQMPEAAAARHAAQAAAATPASEGVPELLAAPDPNAATPPAIAAPAPVTAPLVSAPPEITGGAKQEIAGVQQRAAAAQAEGNATAQTLDSLAQQRQALATQFQQRLANNQAQADKVFDQIQAGRIDPNRLWNSQTTAGKVVSTISIILGGIGAGLTRGPNYALQVIDKATDQDIEAQKVELGKKENLLSHYMQQGNSLMAAHSLAKADLLDVASAQMQKTAAQYQGQKAAADAQIASGQLRQQAAVLRQQGTERELQIKQGQLGLQQQMQQAQALRELMKGISGGGGFDRRVLEMPAFEKFRERAVDLPDGTVGFATDKTEADKAREGFAAVSTLKAKLGRFAELLKSGNPATTDRGTAESLRSDILAEMGHLHGLNRLSDKDLELFQNQVPALTDFVKPMAAQKLRALGKSIDDKVWSLQQNYLSRPGARRPGG